MKRLGLIIAALTLVLVFSQCRKPVLPGFDGETSLRTIEFTTDYGGGQKGVFQEDVAGKLSYHWVAGDVIHVYCTTNEYNSDGTTDFTTNSSFCGVLNNMQIIGESSTQAMFSGGVRILKNAKALRFVHYGRDVTVTNGAATVDYSTQTGLIRDVSNKVISYCDNKYVGDIYKNCKLAPAFAMFKLSFEKFYSNEKVMLKTSGKTAIEVTAGGAISYTTDGEMTFNITSTGESATNKSEYFAVMMPRSSTTYCFSDGSKMIEMTATIAANKYYANGSNGAALVINTNAGTLSGLFTVSPTKQVWFSQGNLQYLGSGADGNSTAIWRFADHQYDYMCGGPENLTAGIRGNVNITGYTADGAGPTGYNNDEANTGAARDLFGWGTSGVEYTNHGTRYMPYHTCANNRDYGPTTSHNLSVSAKSDWGCNTIYAGIFRTTGWRTLTNSQWDSLLFKRNASTINTISNARYSKVSVGGVKGLLIYPDSFTWAEGMGTVPPTTNINNAAPNYPDSYTVEQFGAMESAGVVFLPAAGLRSGVKITDIGQIVGYWSSTRSDSDNACRVLFRETSYDNGATGRYYGLSVRLVRDVTKEGGGSASPFGSGNW